MKIKYESTRQHEIELLYKNTKLKGIKRGKKKLDGKNVIAMNNSGHMSLMCPCCYTLYNADVINSHYFESISPIKIVPSVFISYYTEECPTCNLLDVELVELDYLIAPLISELNKKGFKTIICCEGHSMEENADAAYIYFEDDTIIKYIDFLPDSWYLDYPDIKQNYFSSPEDRNKESSYIIRTSYFNDDSEYVKKIYLEDLKVFVDALPNLNLN